MVDQAAKTNQEGWWLPTFSRASQNVVVAATLLDTLPESSTSGVGEVYQRLKNILNTAIAWQAESSLQHRVEASISSLDCSKAGGATGRPGSSRGRNGLLTGTVFGP
jgi:hypothetical protein